MQISKVMTGAVEMVAPDASLRAAAELMATLDVEMIPVSDGDRLLGMITDHDIVIRGVAEGRNMDTTTVTALMSPNAPFCFADQDTADAADVMYAQHVRRLVILNRDKSLVGIVSLHDVASRAEH